MRFSSLFVSLALVLSSSACKKEKETEDPESGRDSLLGPTVERESVDDLVGGDSEDGESEDAEAELDAEVAAAETTAKTEKAVKCKPPAKSTVKKCSGKGKKKVCKDVDANPGASAAFGVCTLLDHFKWGQSPDEVFKFVTADIEKEYEERQTKSKDPIEQDNNHKWRRDRIKEAKQNHVKFAKATNHRWGVSLIQYEYEDDSNEEMIWTKNDSGLRKFYFFKDNELWKIVYAYSTDNFPGKTYEQVVDEKFRKWFGPSPDAKVKQDPKTAAPIVRYNQWTASNGESIRSFDMTAVHGAIVLAVVDGKAEKRIGERLPNVGSDDKLTDVVNDALGGSDVCYDKSGNIAECAAAKP